MTKLEHYTTKGFNPAKAPQPAVDADFIEMIGRMTDTQFLLFSAAASAALAENDPR